MKKQRLAAALLVGTLAMGLTGCGNSTANAYKKYVELGDYTNIEYTMDVAEVTDQDVQTQLDAFVNGLAEKNEVEREIKEGDIVNIDFVGTMDGEAFEGGSSEGYDLTIGAHMFIDGFEDGLIGHKKGDQVSLDLNFPDPYPNNEDLAGKPVNFAVTVNTVSEKITPELTDQLVADNSDCKTIDEYKEKTRKDMQTQNQTSAESQADTDIMAKVVENAKISGYDEAEVKKLVDEKFEEFQGYTQQYQMSYEELLKAFGYGSEDELKEGITAYVKQYLDMKMVVYCIAAKEGIKVTSDDIQAAAEDEASMYGVKAEEVLKYNGEEYYEYKLMSDQVKELIKKTAKQVDSTEASSEESKDADTEATSEEAAE